MASEYSRMDIHILEIRSKTGVVFRHRCKLCNTDFRDQWAIRRHLRRDHPIECQDPAANNRPLTVYQLGPVALSSSTDDASGIGGKHTEPNGEFSSPGDDMDYANLDKYVLIEKEMRKTVDSEFMSVSKFSCKLCMLGNRLVHPFTKTRLDEVRKHILLKHMAVVEPAKVDRGRRESGSSLVKNSGGSKEGADRKQNSSPEKKSAAVEKHGSTNVNVSSKPEALSSPKTKAPSSEINTPHPAVKKDVSSTSTKQSTQPPVSKSTIRPVPISTSVGKLERSVSKEILPQPILPRIQKRAAADVVASGSDVTKTNLKRSISQNDGFHSPTFNIDQGVKGVILDPVSAQDIRALPRIPRKVSNSNLIVFEPFSVSEVPAVSANKASSGKQSLAEKSSNQKPVAAVSPVQKTSPAKGSQQPSAGLPASTTASTRSKIIKRPPLLPLPVPVSPGTKRASLLPLPVLASPEAVPQASTQGKPEKIASVASVSAVKKAHLAEIIQKPSSELLAGSASTAAAGKPTKTAPGQMMMQSPVSSAENRDGNEVRSVQDQLETVQRETEEQYLNLPELVTRVITEKFAYAPQSNNVNALENVETGHRAERTAYPGSRIQVPVAVNAYVTTLMESEEVADGKQTALPDCDIIPTVPDKPQGAVTTDKLSIKAEMDTTKSPELPACNGKIKVELKMEDTDTHANSTDFKKELAAPLNDVVIRDSPREVVAPMEEECHSSDWESEEDVCVSDEDLALMPDFPLTLEDQQFLQDCSRRIKVPVGQFYKLFTPGAISQAEEDVNYLFEFFGIRD